MSLLRYISHPEVVVDPDVPVPQWGLSDRGRTRMGLLLSEPWVNQVTRLITSPETKAMEATRFLADHLDLAPEVRPASAEVDRSSTGFVPGERHEILADRLFAEPATSADGWETAEAAQRRVVAALHDLFAPPASDGSDGGDVVVVGHGGVGTLTLCHLDGRAIDRRHDQPGQGHYWTYDRASGQLVHEWRPIPTPQ